MGETQCKGKLLSGRWSTASAIDLHPDDAHRSSLIDHLIAGPDVTQPGPPDQPKVRPAARRPLHLTRLRQSRLIGLDHVGSDRLRSFLA